MFIYIFILGLKNVSVIRLMKALINFIRGILFKIILNLEQTLLVFNAITDFYWGNRRYDKMMQSLIYIDSLIIQRDLPLFDQTCVNEDVRDFNCSWSRPRR